MKLKLFEFRYIEKNGSILLPIKLWGLTEPFLYRCLIKSTRHTKWYLTDYDRKVIKLPGRAINSDIVTTENKELLIKGIFNFKPQHLDPGRVINDI
jgi:hypothetical protein